MGHVSVLALQPALNPFASATRCCSSTPTATATTRTLAPSVRPDILLGGCAPSTTQLAPTTQMTSTRPMQPRPRLFQCGSQIKRVLPALRLPAVGALYICSAGSQGKLHKAAHSNTFRPFDARAQFCSAHSVYSSTHDRCCCAQPPSNRHGRHPHNCARKAAGAHGCALSLVWSTHPFSHEL